MLVLLPLSGTSYCTVYVFIILIYDCLFFDYHNICHKYIFNRLNDVFDGE